MTENIEPGTPVRVVIEGRIAATRRHATPFTVRTDAGTTFDVLHGLDPAVTVTPLDPERPTLDLLSLARIIADTAPDDDDAVDEWLFLPAESRTRAKVTAQAILDHIKAAHPEWTP